ncbi:Hypothetical predicted protein, partial [Scomber scombrus]
SSSASENFSVTKNSNLQNKNLYKRVNSDLITNLIRTKHDLLSLQMQIKLQPSSSCHQGFTLHSACVKVNQTSIQRQF